MNPGVINVHSAWTIVMLTMSNHAEIWCGTPMPKVYNQKKFQLIWTRSFRVMEIFRWFHISGTTAPIGPKMSNESRFSPKGSAHYITAFKIEGCLGWFNRNARLCKTLKTYWAQASQGGIHLKRPIFNSISRLDSSEDEPVLLLDYFCMSEIFLKTKSSVLPISLRLLQAKGSYTADFYWTFVL